jgi:hypothetical protein
VSADKLRKLLDSLNELRSSVYKRRQEKTVLRSALLPVKTEVDLVFPLGMTSQSKIIQFNFECIGSLRHYVTFLNFTNVSKCLMTFKADTLPVT